MSVDTKGLIKGKIDLKEIYNYIVDNYDSEAVYNVDNGYSIDRELSGFIYFKDGEDKRQLYLSEGNNLKWKEKPYLELGIKKDYVYLSLGMWGNSIDIISNIVKNYGGWIDENDCDEIGYIEIPKCMDFTYSDYVQKRTKIENILNDKLSDKEKINIATEILKVQDKLKDIL